MSQHSGLPSTGLGGQSEGTRPESAHSSSFWTGRSALVIPGILLALALILFLGIDDIDVADDTLFGPRAFPWIVIGGLVIVAVLLALSILRNPEVPASHVEEDGTVKSGSATNWTAVAITVGSLVLFLAILEPVGWILSAALVFWGVAVGLGARTYLLTLMVGLVMSSIMQLVFAGLLGLSLPPGVMGLW